jgi:hypothetical protein
MIVIETIATWLSERLATLVSGRQALERGAERFAVLVSPVHELELARRVEDDQSPVVTLAITAGLHQGASMPLKGHQYLIGSGEDCDIVLLDSGVQPRHCQLMREWFGFSMYDLRSGEPRLVAPQRVNYQGGEIEAMYAISGVRLSLRQEPPVRRDAMSEPLIRTRPSWAAVTGAAVAALVPTIVFFSLISPGRSESPLSIPKQIVAGNQALFAQGFGSAHFRRSVRGDLEIVGLVTDAAEQDRLREWLKRAHYGNLHISVQPIAELVQQALHTLAVEHLQIGLHAGQLRIEGTTEMMAVKDRIHNLAEDLRGTVAVEDRVTYIDKRNPGPPIPLPIRLRSVMVGDPSYFLTDEGVRYFVGGMLPDGAEVLAIDAQQIRFAAAGKIIVYNLE